MRGQGGGSKLRPGRLVRLAMVARMGSAFAAARRLGVDPTALGKWLRKLARTEGTEHLPAWNLKGRGPRRKSTNEPQRNA